MLALKVVWLAANCCKVKQGSPLEAPGQGLSAVGMILISSELAEATHWIELFDSTSSKTVRFANKIRLSISVLYGRCSYTESGTQVL